MAPTAEVAHPAHHLPTETIKGNGTVHSTTDAPLDEGHLNKALDYQARAHEFLSRLERAFGSGNAKEVAGLFREDGWYKEMLVTQWDHRAANTPKAIAEFLEKDGKLSKQHTVKNFVLEKDKEVERIEQYPGIPWIVAFFTFETEVGKGRGIVRLADDSSGQPLKAHLCFLALEQLKGHETREYETRIQGTEHGELRGGLNWQEQRDRLREFVDEEPDVIIIGAGQSGLMLAYRMGLLGIKALVVDRIKRVGDNWRNRYHSLVLHDPCQYSTWPGLPWPSNWPVYTAKDKLANFMECYVELMELNVWTGANIKSSSYDEAAGEWTYVITRSDGKERTLKPKHTVLATGHSGEINKPTFKGAEDFHGPIVHSSEFTSGKGYEGKKAIVIGSNNSGQDLSVNLVENGWDVTQVQRTGTYFMSTDSVENILLKGLYSDPGPKVEDADLIFNSVPNLVHIPMQREVAKKIADHDRKAIDGMIKQGFNFVMGEDDAGFLMSYYKKGGGYYLGTGAEKMIIDGRIKMKQGQQISHFSKNSIHFADGSSLEADLVVLATGYRNMRETAIKIFGEKEGSRVRPVWGLDDEGELRTVWRPTGHPALWIQAGNLALNRDMSKRLALNIKARLLGLA